MLSPSAAHIRRSTLPHCPALVLSFSLLQWDFYKEPISDSPIIVTHPESAHASKRHPKLQGYVCPPSLALYYRLSPVSSRNVQDSLLLVS